ncbi:MAG: hypothetical protein N2035_01990 [Chthoniobacterales bacterium]|nr:hypothetical protein [Chthoniobacterales bacterium]
MMLSNLLLVCGSAVLTWALHSLGHPFLRRLGTLGVFVTSFLAGWLLGGSLWLGTIFAATWLFLPWIEILFYVRKLRLPIRPPIKHCPPPNSSSFPDLSDLSEQIEQEKYEHIFDAGWQIEDMRNFYRIFYNPAHRNHATICFIERATATFYYTAITTLTVEPRRKFLTWNYPFSYGMLVPKTWKIQRIPFCEFNQMLHYHKQFLEINGIAPEKIEPQKTEELLELLKSFAEEQVRFNIQKGILRQESDGYVRYSLRGMFFLWWEFLWDLFRLS